MAASNSAANHQSKSAVIVLDSSDEEDCTVSKSGAKRQQQHQPVTARSHSISKLSHTNHLENSLRRQSGAPKRVKPTLISSTISTKLPKINGESTEATCPIVHTISDDPLCLDDAPNYSQEINTSSSSISTNAVAYIDVISPYAQSSPSTSTASMPRQETPVNTAFATLIAACRAADTSADMEQLINKKLIRYYQTVHPDFVNSKSFMKTALSIAAEINAQPSLVYLKLASILEELNVRRKSGQTVMVNEDSATSTGDAKKDFQIKRLNQALYVLKKKIAKLDEAPVDLNDEENSAFLLEERYKKRACEIYEKICDLTGESKHAYREVRKPIVFQGTNYPLFNKTITSFVNRTHVFPDLFDVLRCLEHCNSQYEFGLSKEEVKRIAQDAFIKIGKSLQKRRKNDLYETVSYFTGTAVDPATEDQALQKKLSENEKFHSRINEIIDRFANEQSNPGDAAPNSTKAQSEDDKNPETTPHNNNNNTITQNDSVSSTALSICDKKTTPTISPHPSKGTSATTSHTQPAESRTNYNCTTSIDKSASSTTTTVIYNLDEDDDEDNQDILLIPAASSTPDSIFADHRGVITEPASTKAVVLPPIDNGYIELDSSENIVLSDDEVL